MQSVEVKFGNVDLPREAMWELLKRIFYKKEGTRALKDFIKMRQINQEFRDYVDNVLPQTQLYAFSGLLAESGEGIPALMNVVETLKWHGVQKRRLIVQVAQNMDLVDEFLVAAGDKRDIVKALLKLGASHIAKQDALLNAIKRDDLDMVQLLLKYGTSVRHQDYDNEIYAEQTDNWWHLSPVIQCVIGEGHLSILVFLMLHGADIFIDGWALHAAVSEGPTECVKFLVEQGANVHFYNYLYVATSFYRLRNLEYLFPFGTEEERVEAYDEACNVGSLECLSFLHENGVRIPMQDLIGGILWQQYQNEDFEILQFLLDNYNNIPLEYIRELKNQDTFNHGRVSELRAVLDNYEKRRLNPEEEGPLKRAKEPIGVKFGNVNLPKEPMWELLKRIFYKKKGTRALRDFLNMRDVNQDFRNYVDIVLPMTQLNYFAVLLDESGEETRSIVTCVFHRLRWSPEQQYEMAVKLLMLDQVYGPFLMEAACRTGNLKLVQYLEGRGVALGTHQAQLAANYGQLETLLYLETKGIRIEPTLAIAEAAKRGKFETVKYVFEAHIAPARKRGYDIHYSEKRDALRSAATGGDVETFQFLQAQFNITDKSDLISCLSIASEFGHLPLVQYLIRLGLPASGNWIHTPIIGAARAGHLDIVRYLIEHGSVGVNHWALDAAARRGHLDIVKYLVESAGEDLKYLNGYVLVDAAMYGNLEVVRYLFQHGATGSVKAALEAALENGHTDVARYLMSVHQDDTNRYSDRTAEESPLKKFKERRIGAPVLNRERANAVLLSAWTMLNEIEPTEDELQTIEDYLTDTEKYGTNMDIDEFEAHFAGNAKKMADAVLQEHYKDSSTPGQMLARKYLNVEPAPSPPKEPEKTRFQRELPLPLGALIVPDIFDKALVAVQLDESLSGHAISVSQNLFERTLEMESRVLVLLTIRDTALMVSINNYHDNYRGVIHVSAQVWEELGRQKLVNATAYTNVPAPNFIEFELFARMENPQEELQAALSFEPGIVAGQVIRDAARITKILVEKDPVQFATITTGEIPFGIVEKTN